MSSHKVTFLPFGKSVQAKAGTTLLQAAADAGLVISSVCGGSGICCRCKMIIESGDVKGDVTGGLADEEVEKGMVLACLTRIESDLTVTIPAETHAEERVEVNKDAQKRHVHRR